MTRADPVDILKDLISIPSVNPEDGDDPDVVGEGRMLSYLSKFLGDRGFRLEQRGAIPDRRNLIARFGSGHARTSLLIEAHMDTVSVRNMTRPPFEPEVSQGRMYGRGACDTKGPMAAALAAFTPECLERLDGAGVELIFVGAMGEEKGNQGADELVSGGLGADEALILEPTELAVVHAHKGALWLAVELEGKSGHGSDPEGAVSAIAAAASFIEWLRDDTQQAAEQEEDGLLGSPTVNVGKIEGGQALNIVPARCRIEIDRRSLPRESHDQIVARIRRHLDDLKAAGRILQGRVEILKDARPFRTASESPAVQRLLQACEEEGLAPRHLGSSWFSDAGPFSRTCGDVLVFGPGSIQQAHTADEYIDLENLRRGRHIIERYLMQLADDIKSRRSA